MKIQRHLKRAKKLYMYKTIQQALEKRTALILILTNPYVKEKGKHQNK